MIISAIYTIVIIHCVRNMIINNGHRHNKDMNSQLYNLKNFISRILQYKL